MISEGRATLAACTVAVAVVLMIASGGLESISGRGTSESDFVGNRRWGIASSMESRCGESGCIRRSGTLDKDTGKNSTITNSSTTSVMNIVIEKNTTTVLTTENRNESAQNLSVIEQELLQSFDGFSLFTNSGLAPETTVLQWVLAVLFGSFGMLFIWIGSSRRSKGRLADVALLFTLMFMISCIGYLGMALGLGLLYEAVGVEVMPDITINPGNVITKPVHPPVFWLRHVAWALSTPLQLLLLMHVADEASPKATKMIKAREIPTKRVPFTLKFYLIGLNSCIHACGCIGTLVPVVQVGKWTYWVFGMLIYWMLLRQLYGTDSVLVRTATQNKKLAEYQLLVRFVVLSWTFFPFIWVISDGFRTVDADVREDLYAVLEVLNKIGFLLLFIDVSDLPHIPRWLRWTSRVLGALIGRKRGEGGGRESEHWTRKHRGAPAAKNDVVDISRKSNRQTSFAPDTITAV